MQMRMEVLAEEMYRKTHPKEKKFDPRKMMQWMEANQFTPEFIGLALDILFVPQGHNLPVSQLLENGSLSMEETKEVMRAISFFAPSGGGKLMKHTVSRKPSKSKTLKTI